MNKSPTQKGAALLLFVIFFLIASVGLVFMIARGMYSDQIMYRWVAESKQSLYTAEALAEDLSYRMIKPLAYDATETFALAGAHATATVAFDSANGKFILTSIGALAERYRTTKLVLALGSGASFNYGLQSDAGGINLKNTASIKGNVFSNGPITGANSNIVRGEAISAGSAGLISGVHATGTAYANSITNSTIDDDAYYQTISGTSVGGTAYPNSPNQATAELPISDDQIDEWKTAAESGGTYSGTCPYKIEENTSIGPIKIPCDLQISGDPEVTLNGNIWVDGNVEVQNTAEVKVGSSLSGKTVAIIADDTESPASKGLIQLKNSVVFNGMGDNSYILFISGNTSAELGGNNVAIEVQNNAQGDVLVYAAHGKIVLKNSVNLKEVSAYRIEVQNSAVVTYESGLVNLLFTSGPGGGFEIDSWQEI